MADQDDTTAQQGAQGGNPSGLQISDQIRKEFPELLALILGSQSMNDEERQYWINILPIMTPDQLKNLDEILTNEKQQLAAIDQKYAEAGPEPELDPEAIAKREQRRQELHNAEKQQVQEEEEMAEDILKQIDEF